MSKQKALTGCFCLVFVSIFLAGTASFKSSAKTPPGTRPGTPGATSEHDLPIKAGKVIEVPAHSPVNAISVSPAHNGSLRQSMKLSSTIASSTPGTASVTSLVHGVVTKILVDVGDIVKAGQIVAYINCPEIADAKSAYEERKSRKIEAAANVELVKRRLALGENESGRLKTLFSEGISAKKDFEGAQSKIASTEAELQTSIALLAAAKIQLTSAASRLSSLGIDPGSVNIEKLSTELPLRSPISGLVSQKTAQPGQPVGPLGGASNPALFTIVDLSKVWVMLEVPQSENLRITLGARVTFTTEVAPGKKFTGRVTRLGQTFDSMSRTASFRTEVQNPQLILKPGMLVLADVSTTATSSTHVLVLNTAIQKLARQNFVFRKIGSRKFAACPVTIGETNGISSEIISGIADGDLIVTNGSFLLKSELMKDSLGGEQ